MIKLIFSFTQIPSMASQSHNQNQNQIREPPYEPVIVKVLIAQQYEQEKGMLRTQILIKTAELELARQKVKAIILQKSILLNQMAQFEPGSQTRQAQEKQMEAKDLFEQAAEVYVEAVEIELQSTQQDLHHLEDIGVEKWIERRASRDF